MYVRKNKKLSRGYRNNNPLNIRKGSKWMGLSQDQPDRDFCCFSSMAYGFRAAFIILCKSYYGKKVVTIDGIIRRWAPSSENDTESYILRVCKALRITRYTMLPKPAVGTKNIWVDLALAMANHENGFTYQGLQGDASLGFDLVFPPTEKRKQNETRSVC